MGRRGQLLLVILAVPALAFLVASGLLWKYEKEWQGALAKEFQDAPAEKRASFTLEWACAQPKLRQYLEAGCSTLDSRKLMRTGAVATAGAGLSWLLLIGAAGRLARSSRKVLLHVFRPGLYLTNAFLVVLIAAYGVLAVMAIYLGEAALIGRIHVGIIFAIGVGALAGVAAIARMSFSVIRTVAATVVGSPVTATDSPALWTLVRDLAQRVGTQPPNHIVVGLDPNFFVIETPVQAIGGELRGRTLFISLPLARILTEDEIRSVIGHELGHYKGEDTMFSRKFFPIYRGTHDTLEALAASGGEGAGSLALMPAMAVLSFFFDAFAVAERGISRERELTADAVGVSLVDSRAMATALTKISAFAGYWPAIRTEMTKVLREGKVFTNISQLFGQVATEQAGPEVLEGLGDRRLTHPTDTHPPLSVRLEHLGVSLHDVARDALQVAPEQPAIALVADYEKHEEYLNQIEHYLLSRSLGIALSDEQEKAPSDDNAQA